MMRFGLVKREFAVKFNNVEVLEKECLAPGQELLGDASDRRLVRGSPCTANTADPDEGNQSTNAESRTQRDPSGTSC